MTDIEIKYNEQTFSVPLGDDLTLRKQNPDCAKKQCLCAVYNNQDLVCFKISLKEDANKQLIIGEMKPCSHNPSKKIHIEG